MAAPTNAANVKKVLANPEPSTHGTKLPIRDIRYPVANRGRPDMVPIAQFGRDCPFSDIKPYRA